MISGIWKRSDNGYTRELRFHIPRLAGDNRIGRRFDIPSISPPSIADKSQGIKGDIHNDVPSPHLLKETPRLYIFLFD